MRGKNASSDPATVGAHSNRSVSLPITGLAAGAVAFAAGGRGCAGFCVTPPAFGLRVRFGNAVDSPGAFDTDREPVGAIFAFDPGVAEVCTISGGFGSVESCFCSGALACARLRLETVSADFALEVERGFAIVTR